LSSSSSSSNLRAREGHRLDDDDEDDDEHDGGEGSKHPLAPAMTMCYTAAVKPPREDGGLW